MKSTNSPSSNSKALEIEGRSMSRGLENHEKPRSKFKSKKDIMHYHYGKKCHIQKVYYK